MRVGVNSRESSLPGCPWFSDQISLFRQVLAHKKVLAAPSCHGTGAQTHHHLLHPFFSQPQCGWAQASPMGTPSLGSSPDTEALLYLCLRTEQSKKPLLGHCSDPLKLMGLNHPGASHQLQKNYTRDESGAIIFFLCAFQKDDLLSRLLCSAYIPVSQSF